MNQINSYRDLKVYQKAMDLTVEIYSLTKEFPTEEKYGLVVQMRRAAVSVVSNIAEGYRRRSLKDYIRFLIMANGSVSELEAQLEVCKRIEWLTNKDYSTAESLANEVTKMLCSLIGKLSQKR